MKRDDLGPLVALALLIYLVVVVLTAKTGGCGPLTGHDRNGMLYVVALLTFVGFTLGRWRR
jgi:hypothetical protein